MSELRDAVSSLSGAVSVDLFENDESYLLVIDLPGASAEETTVSTAEDTLHVRATRSLDITEEATVIEQHRAPRRSLDLPLPADADAENATASIADGVLEIRIPRTTPGTTIPIEDD